MVAYSNLVKSLLKPFLDVKVKTSGTLMQMYYRAQDLGLCSHVISILNLLLAVSVFVYYELCLLTQNRIKLFRGAILLFIGQAFISTKLIDGSFGSCIIR